MNTRALACLLALASVPVATAQVPGIEIRDYAVTTPGQAATVTVAFTPELLEGTMVVLFGSETPGVQPNGPGVTTHAMQTLQGPGPVTWILDAGPDLVEDVPLHFRVGIVDPFVPMGGGEPGDLVLTAEVELLADVTRPDSATLSARLSPESADAILAEWVEPADHRGATVLDIVETRVYYAPAGEPIVSGESPFVIAPGVVGRGWPNHAEIPDREPGRAYDLKVEFRDRDENVSPLSNVATVTMAGATPVPEAAPAEGDGGGGSCGSASAGSACAALVALGVLALSGPARQ